MAQRSLVAEARSEVGKNAARRLRSRGRIPGIVYGHTQPRMVSIDAKEFALNFKTISESALITLKLPDAEVDVLVKDYQQDLLAGRIVHLDFYEVDRNKALRTHVNLKFTGNPKGVRDGGVLDIIIHDIEIECLPRDLPEEISIDMTDLEIGQSIHVRQLVPPAGVAFRTSGDQTVCLVAVHKVVEEKPAEAAVEAVAAEGEAAAAEGAEKTDKEEE
jgi:large subunit ribosomal protein L25